MKLKEKLADEWNMESVKERPLQPFEDYSKASKAWMAGFDQAKVMATIQIMKARDSYMGHDSYILEGYISCSQVAEYEIKKLGEEEIQ